MFDDSLLIVTAGVNLTTSGSSTSSALPNTGAGAAARVVRVAATQAAYVNFGTSGVAATTANILVQPADSVVLTLPRGVTHFAAIQEGTAGKVNVQAIEY